MSINCQIIEATKKEDYATMKQDYLNGIRGEKFRQKYNIGKSAYRRILRDFKQDGIKLSNRGRTRKTKHEPHYITIVRGFPQDKFRVQKVINKKHYWFGEYETYEKAKAKVVELKQSNWGGLL